MLELPSPNCLTHIQSEMLNEGRTCLTKNSVLTDYLKVGLRVNRNGPRMKPQLEFS